MKYLKRGHAIHFRCQHAEALGMPIDIMSKMRGVEPFSKLARRRTTIELPGGSKCDLLSLPDLVQATQIRFWLRELRTPALLIEIAQSHPKPCRRLAAERPLLAKAAAGQGDELERALHDEETVERQRDKLYWLPLRMELEKLRHAK